MANWNGNQLQCKAFVKKCRQCGWIQEGKRQKACPVCGRDLRCPQPAVSGWAVCNRHGGPNPKHNFYGKGRNTLTGEGSHFPLVRLAAKYNQIQEDGRILSNRYSLELVRERIRGLAERIDLNEAPERLKTLHDLWEERKSLHAAGKELEARAVDALIDDEFEKAYHDYASWEQMFEAIDLDRKLVESEAKVMQSLRAILTAEDAYQLTAKILSSIMAAVNSLPDVSATVKGRLLKRIQYDFIRLVGDRSSIETGAGLGGADGEILNAGSGEMD